MIAIMILILMLKVRKVLKIFGLKINQNLRIKYAWTAIKKRLVMAILLLVEKASFTRK